MIKLTVTSTPSRSKQAGPCWIAAEHGGDLVYAKVGGTPIDVEPGAELTVRGKATLRRASGRSDVDRERWTLVAEEGATATLEVGSPQCVRVQVEGARLAGAR